MEAGLIDPNYQIQPGHQSSSYLHPNTLMAGPCPHAEY